MANNLITVDSTLAPEPFVKWLLNQPQHVNLLDWKDAPDPVVFVFRIPHPSS